MPEPDEDETALYQVAPPEFVAARDALAKRLRSEGRKADAGRVAKLRRPPPSAWALNRVARAEPALVDGLLDAGRGLRVATERAVAGDASGLRGARAAERASVDAVIGAAAAHLAAIGVTANDVTRQRLAATLRAAIVDPSVAESWRQATLAADHDTPGFGLEAFSAPAPAPAPAQPPGQPGPLAPQDADHRPGPDPRSEVERLEAEAERQAAAWSRLVVEAARASAEAERLAEESTRLSTEAQRLAAEAARAAEVASAAEARAAGARDGAVDAEARAAEAERESAQARARAAAARAVNT